MSIRDLPRLRTSNPFVFAFYASVLVVWVLAAKWLYFRGGAEMLVGHPGLVRASSPLGVKLYAGACLLGGSVALVVLYLKSR